MSAPLAQLTGYEVQGHSLHLFLSDGRGLHTRTLNLNEAEAGLAAYNPKSGVGVFTEGFNPVTTVEPMTREGVNGSEQGYYVRYEHVGDFGVKAHPYLLERLAGEVWPIMRAHPVRRPTARFVPRDDVAPRPARGFSFTCHAACHLEAWPVPQPRATNSS